MKSTKNNQDHYAVALKIAKDEDPVAQAFVHRRCTLTQEQWEKYLGTEDPESLTIQYSTSSLASAKGAAPVQHKGGLLRKTTVKYDVEASGRNPRENNRFSRSIFGLPLISPLSRCAKYWSTMILALDLVYTAFLIPILVAFEVPDIGWTWGCIINLIAGTFYFVELCLNFHIGFIGKYGTQKRMIMDGKAVAWYYITQGQFFVDCITAVAYFAQITLIILSEKGVEINGKVATLYQIIRILRIIRFVSLMNRLYASAIAAGGAIFPALNLKPHYAYFVNLIYGGLAILNFLSCIINFTARREGCTNTWVNRFGVFLHTYGSDAANTAGILGPDECVAVPEAAKWLGGMYFMLVTMLSIGYGDITPQSITEIIIVMFCMIAGIIFFGILLGSIAEALTDLNKESKRIAKYRARMESVDKWMGKRGLSKKLRHLIGQHYQEEWIADSEAIEEVQVMEEVPYALRREISYSINKKIFERLGVFHDGFSQQDQIAIAALMTPMQLPAGADICEAGDVADCLWILHEGSVAAVDANGIETRVTTAPALLGETALLRELDDQHHFRPCALRTRQMCLLWVLPTRDLLPLLRRKPTLYHKAVLQAVPGMQFDYLAVDPIGNNVGGGVAGDNKGNAGKKGASENGASNGSSGSSLVNSRKGNGPQNFQAVAAAAQAAANMEARTQQRTLHTAHSASAVDRPSKPSWTTLQQGVLASQRNRVSSQSAGFNGLISKH
ncbi:probable potassium/sodium hyperpolarization-activated cyclic nucleotide-gated channel [Coccomyxa sp. Obi]|nr:probable potassium/sodium hyperpolarization-activated cyclic nucleotide-gated channel [Coccomyxa sp. Obi]